MQEVNIFLAIAVLIMSVVLHEVSHGYVAQFLGDPTARLSGRLTLNPLKHLDPLGSVILPLILYLLPASNIIFGWARPVPYNPYNLRMGKYGPAIVAAAGPLMNIFIALFFGVLWKAGILKEVGAQAYEFIVLIVQINLLLAFFNLIPIPPLDGSKVLAAVLPYAWYREWQGVEELLARYGLLMFFLLIFLVIQFFMPVVFGLVSFFTRLFMGV